MKRSASFIIIFTFVTAIALGTFLLRMPAATVNGSLSLQDAFFTSTSAVTVTGLIVVDTATTFTFFGQVVILLLLQFGGLGFMTLSTMFILLMGKSISLKDKFIIENDFTPGSHKNLKDIVKKVFLFTFVLEALGAVVLYSQFNDLEPGRRAFDAVFHSVSAFCNAGFSTFSNSLENYTSHIGINVTVIFLIILGGIGFLVLDEMLLFLRGKIKKFSRLSLHSRLVLISSLILTVGGFLVILVEEILNKHNSGPLGSHILVALFQSVTARTAGFNTINLNAMAPASIFIVTLLMFVGASPGSTGGGVKTTSVGVLFAYFRSRLRGRETIDLFYRNIPSRAMEKAFIVIILAFLLITLCFMLLLTFEKQADFISLLFESVSAFGTVGLSMGVTAQLSLPSKIVVMITMLIGRVGLLTLLMALSRRESKAIFNYPKAEVMIG